VNLVGDAADQVDPVDLAGPAAAAEVKVAGVAGAKAGAPCKSFMFFPTDNHQPQLPM